MSTPEESEGSTGRTERRRIVVKRGTTSPGRSEILPVELKPRRRLSEKQKNWIANTRAKKNGTTFDDEYAIVNQEEAELDKHTQNVDGREMIPTNVLPKKRIENSIRRKRKKKKLSQAQIEAKAQAKVRAEQALELRKAGVTYAKIAEMIGFSSAGAAKNSIDKYLRDAQFEAAKDVVLIDLQRLDEYQMRCTERLRNTGDLGQIDRLMRIMQMRYNILGVNEETTAELQQHFGLNVVNKGVMVVQGSEQDFVRTMMQAVGVDPDSPEGRAYVGSAVGREIESAPMRGTDETTYDAHKKLSDEDIIEAEIIEEMDSAYDV